MRSSLLAAVLIVSAVTPLSAQTAYPLTADSERHPGVPRGTLTKHAWSSQIFPGTQRDYWVYLPAQYDPRVPAALMVFQDGSTFVNEEGRWRVPTVFDNLIHRGDMPVTIGVFVNPGVLPAPGPDQEARYNRSYEYDSLGDRYARFLVDELLPEVGKTHRFTADPNLRAIGGSSSGGICAFTVAWNRPDAFRRVLSFIGSYTNLRGGFAYPSLVRKMEPKPLRVFLQDGTHDNNLYSGNWWIGNQDMASALEYAGYDQTFVTGDQGHNNIHGSAILPDALRWLWRKGKDPIAKSTGKAAAERHFVTQILDPAHEWEMVSEGHKFTEGPAVDAQGNVYFTDIPNNRIHKIVHATGKVGVFKEDSGGANGLMFGPDGRLYACQSRRKRIVAYSPDGAETVLATDVDSNDLVVSARGEVFFTDPALKRIWLIDAKGDKRVVYQGVAWARRVDEGIEFPNGIRLSPDQSLLLVADYRSRWVWSFQVGTLGALANPQPFYRLETPDDSVSAGADGMTVDSEGYLYVATRLGAQICDQPGRVTAILNKPQPSSLSNVVFGGENLDTLYVTAGDKVFRRQVRRKGVFPWKPARPPQPRL